MKKFCTILLLMVFQLSCKKYETRSSAEINSLRLPGSNVWNLYTEFEKIIEHFTLPENKTAIVVGKEKVTPARDANRTDTGKPHERSFTEVWVYRGGLWKRSDMLASLPATQEMIWI
jgi:hypothetical protein